MSSVEQENQLEIVQKMVYSPNGQIILTVSGSRSARQWSSLTGKFRPLSIELPKNLSVASLSYSIDDIPITVVSQDKALQLWDLRTGSPKTVLEGSSVEKVTSPCHLAVAGSLLLTRTIIL